MGSVEGLLLLPFPHYLKSQQRQEGREEGRTKQAAFVWVAELVWEWERVWDLLPALFQGFASQNKWDFSRCVGAHQAVFLLSGPFKENGINLLRNCPVFCRVLQLDALTTQTKSVTVLPLLSRRMGPLLASWIETQGNKLPMAYKTKQHVVFINRSLAVWSVRRQLNLLPCDQQDCEGWMDPCGDGSSVLKKRNPAACCCTPALTLSVLGENMCSARAPALPGIGPCSLLNYSHILVLWM